LHRQQVIQLVKRGMVLHLIFGVLHIAVPPHLCPVVSETEARRYAGLHAKPVPYVSKQVITVILKGFQVDAYGKNGFGLGTAEQVRAARTPCQLAGFAIVNATLPAFTLSDVPQLWRR
jgi:hypothetical protein